MSRKYRIVIGLLLSLVLILALSTVAFAGNRGSNSDDHRGNKPGKSQYHRCDDDNKASSNQYGCKEGNKDRDDDRNDDRDDDRDDD